MQKFVFVTFLFFFVVRVLIGQEKNNAVENTMLDGNKDQAIAWKPSVLKLDFPLFDLPYQIDVMNTAENNGFLSTYGNPSMNQSLAVTLDVYSAMHFGLKKFMIRFL